MKPTYELLQKQLTCLKYLEERVTEIYETLARADLGLASTILRYIARSSRNHAESIMELLQHIGIEPLRSTEYCYDIGGIVFKLLREVEVELLGKGLSRESIAKVLNSLASGERLVGEELYVAIVLSLIMDYIVDSYYKELVKALIEAIRRDEETHAYLVRVVISHL